MDDQLEKLQSLVDKFKILKGDLVPDLTFFEIAGFPSRENVFSNVLKYFFTPTNPHGYGIQLLKIFLNGVCEIDDDELARAYVRREVVTNLQKRIDLIVVTDKHVIGVENKVYHILNNDLKHYREFLKSNYNDRDCHMVVLSLYGNNNQAAGDVYFKSYKDFIAETEECVPTLTNKKYELFFREFIQNVKNHFPSFMTNEQIKFLQKNESDIEELTKLSRSATNFVTSMSNEIQKRITLDQERWYFYRELNYSFEIQTQKGQPQYKIACTIELSSIYIEVFCDKAPLFRELQSWLGSNFDDAKLDGKGVIEVRNEWLYVWETLQITEPNIENSVATEIKKIINLIDQFKLEIKQDV